MNSKTGICLEAGLLRAEIRPEIGGSLSRFWSMSPDGETDWLHPATPEGLATGDARAMSCFPLVPFSNRIRDGRFTFEDREICLPLNFGDHPHTIHGHGWQAPWQVVKAEAHSALIQYRHEADAWPWSYLAAQRFTLNDTALTIAISLTNLGDTAMPAGIGLHPYFPRDETTTILATVEGQWRGDAEVMPTDLVPADTVWPSDTPLLVDGVSLDNCFTGWKHALDIKSTATGRAMRMEASATFDFLVVYTPPGKAFFCAEPVSHCNDAVNLAPKRDDTGMVILRPGATLSGEVVFRPQLDD